MKKNAKAVGVILAVIVAAELVDSLVFPWKSKLPQRGA